MTEKEKMLNKLLYNANDIELEKERLKAKKLCQEYNREVIGKANESILASLLGKIGKNITILPTFWCDYGYNIEIGNNFFSNHNLVILDCAKVKIGDNVFIGPNSGIYTATHPVDATTRNEGKEYAYPITIGNNVWIGGNVTILGGVTIKDNVIIGAGSVVNKDIPDNSIVAGVPSRIIKKL